MSDICSRDVIKAVSISGTSSVQHKSARFGRQGASLRRYVF